MASTTENQDELPDQVSTGDVEELITDLSCVLCCRIVCSDWGAIREIHVLAEDDRNPKQIVRDIESALAARWGLQVDHKRISVAQISIDKSEDEVKQQDYYYPLELVSISSTSLPGEKRLKTKVVLSVYEDEQISGYSSGNLNRPEYGRFTAEASVRAINKALNPSHSLYLEDIRFIDMAAGTVACVQLYLSLPRGGPEVIVGIVPVKNDKSFAAVEAVLDAANPQCWPIIAENKVTN